jgi:Flp pilus assembly protein TadG
MRRNLIKYFHARGRDVSRFSRAERGATAVEFAIIAPVFIATIVALLQVCIFVFAQMAIQTAAVQAGRYFMTGQAQNGSWTASDIINDVCTNTNLSLIFNCTKMFVVAQDAASFAAANTSAPALYNGAQLNNQSDYTFDNTANPGGIMVVQLIYPWPVLSGPLGFNISNLPNNQAELMGITAFRVEPYL